MIEPADLFRIYDETECGEDGYPFAWHKSWEMASGTHPAVKDLVRENVGNRCLRCWHPYTKGDGQWSRCEHLCLHGGLIRYREAALGDEDQWHEHTLMGPTAGQAMLDEGPLGPVPRWDVEAAWRILTVHHLLTGPEGKRNLRWWNLVALCQRCHLIVQRKVELQKPWPWPHSVWFRPYAAGWYAWSHLGENLTRAETMARLPELLSLEERAERLWPT